MRKREDILKDGTRLEILQLEVLLDIRELLKKQEKQTKKVLGADPKRLLKNSV